MSDILERYGLTRVINVSGTMTSLGASLVGPGAIEAAADIQSEFVCIDELQARASAVIARLTGSEAGCVTACSAAAMTTGVAAAMTGCDLAAIERLPDTTDLRDEVVIPSGHMVNYGAPVEQSIRLAGANVVPVGSAAMSERFHLQRALSQRTAAGMFVVSHHVVQDGQLLLEDFIDICHGNDVPVIVDMASEYDLRAAIGMGADMAIYSAHKAFGGPTGGIIAGKKGLVRATYLQNRGIGRQMKIGKEGIVGAIACLEAWENRDHAAIEAAENNVVMGWLEVLSDTPGLNLDIHPDWTGNPINRLKVSVNPDMAGLYAWELADRLRAGTPAIQVRDDLIEHGYFFLDPCNLRPDSDEQTVVANRIREVISAALRNKDGRRISLSQRRRTNAEGALSWLE